MSDRSFFDRIEAGISNIVFDFSQHPADYLFESDLQCALFSSLKDNFRDLTFDSRSSDLPLLLGHNPTINPVKSEYPYDFEGRTCDRFDVAILDSQQNPLYRIYRQPCRFGIEIKLLYPDGPMGNIWSDVKKLKRYSEFATRRRKEFSGLAILFVFPNAEKRLPAELQGSLCPTIAANEVSLHVVMAKKNAGTSWSRVPIPQNNHAEVLGGIRQVVDHVI